METNKYQNELMQHTIGLSNGEDRNWFGTGSKGKDAIEFDKLVIGGLAIRVPAPSWSGDDVIYHLTDKGKQVAKDNMPIPEPVKKLTRSQKNYQDFLRSECSESFAEWMGFA